MSLKKDISPLPVDFTLATILGIALVLKKQLLLYAQDPLENRWRTGIGTGFP